MRIKLFLIFSITILFMFVGCGGTKQTQLSPPQNLKIEGQVLVWDEVEGAIGYTVFAGGIEYVTTQTTLDLSFLKEGNYTVKVMARGNDENHTNSEWSEINCLIRPLSLPQNLKVEEQVLLWDAVEGAIGYTVFVGGKEYETTQTTFDLSFLKEGNYTVKVMARGDDENYTNSGWSNIKYSAQTVVPTGDFKYTLLEDGSGYEVHRGDVDLEGTIVIPDTYNDLPVKKISDMAFQLAERPEPSKNYGCNLKTTEVILPKYLEEIGNNAFGYCLNLSTVKIPEGVKRIGDEAFIFTKIVNLQIPDGVESIGEYAFAFCPLVDVALPNTLKDIPRGLFYDCSFLENVQFPAKIESFGSSVMFETKWYYHFPDNYVTVGGFLLGYKGTGTMDAIPNTVTYIVDRAFSNTEEYNSGYFVNCIAKKAVLPKFVTLGEGLFYQNDYITEVVLEEGTESISDDAFAECSNLQSVSIPESVTNIGAGAFRRTNLTKVVLPSGLTYISQSAFNGCRNLKEIVWPENLFEIGDYAFTGCAFETFDIPQSVGVIGKMAFQYNRFESVNIPVGVTYLGDRAFEGCSELTSITIPSTVDYIGERAFADCPLLDNVILPEGIEEVNAGMFASCKALKTIYLPDSVKEIGARAFEKCSALETIQLPQNLQAIGNSAFYDCINLRSIDLPQSVKTVGGSCFSSCDLLEEIDLSMVENTAGVLSFCQSLTRVILPANMTSVPVGYFIGCSGLKEIVLPKNVKKVEKNNFSNCPALKLIYFCGTQQEFDAIEVEVTNESFLNAMVYFYSEAEPALNADGTAYIDGYWHYAADNKTPVIWKKEGSI